MLRTRVRPVLAALLIGLVLTACSSEGTPNLGDWTLKSNDLTLTETLRVSETANYFFGSIQDLDVTSTGRMVVFDSKAHHLKVLRADGTLIDTLGRPGKGPGEFQGVSVVDVARDDSVYVFDAATERLTVFALLPSPLMARSVVIARKLTDSLNYLQN
jgi:hypothetical protein